MKKIKAHILVCTHKTCEKQGSKESLRSLKRAIKRDGLRDRALISKVKCLEQCGHGPVMVVYPAGVWYGGVDEEGARAIVEEQLGRGRRARGPKILKILCPHIPDTPTEKPPD